MHRSGRSDSLNFRNQFGGHSVMVAVLLEWRLRGLMNASPSVSMDPNRSGVGRLLVTQ
jgi:hypothetical protein